MAVAPKAAAALVLLVLFAVSSSCLPLPASRATSRFDFLPRIAELCPDSEGDSVSYRMRDCAAEVDVAFILEQRFPEGCCRIVGNVVTAGKKRCACGFVKEAAHWFQIDVIQKCEQLGHAAWLGPLQEKEFCEDAAPPAAQEEELLQQA